VALFFAIIFFVVIARSPDSSGRRSNLRARFLSPTVADLNFTLRLPRLRLAMTRKVITQHYKHIKCHSSIWTLSMS